MTGAQGIGSTGRKSVNASRINTTIGNTSVLNERVLRISEKINEIHVRIRLIKYYLLILTFYYSKILRKAKVVKLRNMRRK